MFASISKLVLRTAKLLSMPIMVHMIEKKNRFY